MTLMTRAYILDKYGVRLSMEQVAECLGLAPRTIYNLLSTGEMQIPTYKEGARRWASYEAVADYLDRQNELAKAKRPAHASP